MMKNLLCLLLAILCLSYNINSQTQILVLNEGSYDYINNRIDVPVSIGSYSPATKLYSKILEIENARFASDIKLHGDYYWVAADQELIKISLKNNSIVHKIPVTGVRKIDFWNDIIIVTRGEYNKTLDSYIQFYSLKDYSLLKEISSTILPYTTESILISNNKAYIGVNNGFVFGEEVGKIIEIDLPTLSIAQTIELGDTGKNPENLMLEGNYIYSLNNKNYNGSSISAVSLNDYAVQHVNLPGISSLCGTSTLVEHNVWYQEIGKTEMGIYFTSTKQANKFKDIEKSFYGMSYDPASHLVYAAETDFKTNGIVNIYNDKAEWQTSFKAGITPGYFAFDYSTISKANNLNTEILNVWTSNENKTLQFPNIQSLDNLIIQNNEGKIIINKQKFKEDKLDIQKLSSGIYFVNALRDNHLVNAKFIKY